MTADERAEDIVWFKKFLALTESPLNYKPSRRQAASATSICRSPEVLQADLRAWAQKRLKELLEAQ
jgi:hypothetical protein